MFIYQQGHKAKAKLQQHLAYMYRTAVCFFMIQTQSWQSALLTVAARAAQQAKGPNLCNSIQHKARQTSTDRAIGLTEDVHILYILYIVAGTCTVFWSGYFA